MQDLENNAEVWCVMLELVQEIGTKLRTHKKKAGGIAISIRNNELFTKEWQCRISIPTQSPTYLAKTAFALFDKNYQWEHPIRSVTVRAINLFEEDCPIQYDLFIDVKSLDRQERLDAAIEQIRFRFGKDAIKMGYFSEKQDADRAKSGFGYADRNDWLIQHRQNLVSSLLKEVNTFAGLQRRSVEYVGTEM